ncbi:hypothetical protein ACFOON_17250 [Novosphingobium piscinae]|nr:hypothetical protein [Novosphingobium piscinae]
MARALALVAATPLRPALQDRLRMVIVGGCALALILADRALPVF